MATYDDGVFIVPETGESFVIPVEGGPIPSWVDDLTAARDRAETAAGEAESSAVDAASSRDAAAASAASIVGDVADAEAARLGAEAAAQAVAIDHAAVSGLRVLSQADAAAADLSAIASEASRQAAVSARDVTVAARDEVETDRQAVDAAAAIVNGDRVAAQQAAADSTAAAAAAVASATQANSSETAAEEARDVTLAARDETAGLVIEATEARDVAGTHAITAAAATTGVQALLDSTSLLALQIAVNANSAIAAARAANATSGLNLSAVGKAVMMDTTIQAVSRYNTRLDSDPSWIERTRALSYYASLGAPPRDMLILIRTGAVDIRDAGDPDLKLWCSFDAVSSNNKFMRLNVNAISDAAGAEGMLAIHWAGTVYLAVIDLTTNELGVFSNAGTTATGTWFGGLEDRNTVNATGFSGTGSPFGFASAIISTAYTSVCMTVRNDSPMQTRRLGLRAPMIGVAGNQRHAWIDIATKSIWHSNDGTTSTRGIAVRDGRVWSTYNANMVAFSYDLPRGDLFRMLGETYQTPATADVFIHDPASAVGVLHAVPEVIANAAGMSIIKRNADNVRRSMVAKITQYFNSLYIPGRDTLVALAESSVAGLGSLTGASPLNDEMNYADLAAFNAAGWVTAGTGISFPGDGTVGLTSGATPTTSTFYRDISTVPGTAYELVVNVAEIFGFNGTSNFLRIGTGGLASVAYAGINIQGATHFPALNVDTVVFRFVALTTTTSVAFGATVTANVGYRFNAVRLREVVQNHAIPHLGSTAFPAAFPTYPQANIVPTVVGAVGREAVAAGAELTCYVTSAGNYINIPVVPSLDFGTGDFTFIGHSKVDVTLPSQACFQLSDALAAAQFANTTTLFLDFSLGVPRIFTAHGGAQVATSAAASVGPGWKFWKLMRRNGVITLIVEGVTVITLNDAAPFLFSTGAGPTFRVGAYVYGGVASGSAGTRNAGFRVVPWAIDDSQYATMLADEKRLFQPNAKCTLPTAGVTNMSEDPETAIRHCAHTVGASSWLALQRLSYTQPTTYSANRVPFSDLSSIWGTLTNLTPGVDVAGPAAWGGKLLPMTENAVNANHQAAFSVATLPAGDYTVGIPMKVGSRSFAGILAGVGATSSKTVNLSTGATGAVSGAGASDLPSVDLGNGVTLVQFVYNLAAPAATAVTVRLGTSISVAGAYAGDNGASGPAVYVGRPMVRAGTTALTAADYAAGSSNNDTVRDVCHLPGAGYVLATAAGLDAFMPAINLRAELGRYTPSAARYIPKTQLDQLTAAQFQLLGATDVLLGCIYDVRNDPDKGAWLGKMGSTSWVRELGRTFPRRSLLLTQGIATSGFVHAYDLDEANPTKPFMSFPYSATQGLFNGGVVPSHIAAFNGEIRVGFNGASGGFGVLDLAGDEIRYHSNNGTFIFGNISERAVSDSTRWSSPATAAGAIFARTVVMSDAYIAPFTPANPQRGGLPNSTISVACNGGASIIRADGTSNSSSAIACTSVVFDRRGNIWWARPNVNVYMIPPAVYLQSGFGAGGLSYSGAAHSPFLITATRLQPTSNLVAVGMASGAFYILPNDYKPEWSAFARVTTEFNTGFAMSGSKFALAESSLYTSDIVGGTAFSDNFASYADTAAMKAAGWGESVASSVNLVSGAMQVGGTGAVAFATRGIATTPGVTYEMTVDWSYPGGTGQTILRAGTTSGGFDLLAATQGGGTPVSGRAVFTATTAVTYISFLRNTADANVTVFDNINVRAILANRSPLVGWNPVVTGTLKRAPWAPGCEVAGYYNFSDTNYAEVPYTTDLDFGTGDFVFGPFAVQDVVGSAGSRYIAEFGRTSGGAYAGARLLIYKFNGFYEFYAVNAAGTGYSARSTLTSNVPGRTSIIWGVRRGARIELWVNGRMVVSASGVTGTFTNANGTLTLGRGTPAGPAGPLAWDGMLAHPRYSIGYAPSPDFMRAWYEHEKPLFQTGAKSLLQAAAMLGHAYNPDSNQMIWLGTNGVTRMSGLTVLERQTLETSPLSVGTLRWAALAGDGVQAIGTGQEVVMSFPAVSLRERIERETQPSVNDNTFAQFAWRTPDATPTVIGGFYVPEGGARRFRGLITAQQDGGAATEAAVYRVHGVVHRPIGGNVAFLVAPVITVDGEVTSAMDLTTPVNTAAQAVLFTATGKAATDMIWTTALEVYDAAPASVAA